MAKHKAERPDLSTAIKRKVWYLRNQWYCFVKPSIKRWLAGEENPWRKYYRS